MDSFETLKTLCNATKTYEGYSVFEVDFNGVKVNMMALEDVQQIVSLLDKMYPRKEAPIDKQKQLLREFYELMGKTKEEIDIIQKRMLG